MPSLRSDPLEQETRAAVAVTVVWMLACLSTAAALLVGLGLIGLMRLFPAAPGGVHPLARVAGTLLMASLITGIVNLALGPVALRLRHAPPPRAILIMSLVVGVAPGVVLLVWAFVIG